MKKFLIHIGPDTIAVKAKTKGHVRKRLRAIMGRRKNYAKPFVGDRYCFFFKGRQYMFSEISEAVILTPNEYWTAVYND